MSLSKKEQALKYHAEGKPGKLEIIPTKDTKTQHDLSLCYSPGVAEPCLAIKEDSELAYTYTTKGNLVAVITNGTAVLGLGNIGPLASKPVMEGKAVLFKIFADIDVFDIEINETDPDKFIAIVKSLEPTFGGINLEDIKAPECFYIEENLKKQLQIPVMHDDQHGTAIITSAALINALELQNKKIENIKIVVIGAGAAAMATIKLYVALGANPQHFILFDIQGPLYKGREAFTEDKHKFLIDANLSTLTLSEALKGADMLLGLSAANTITSDMIKEMAPHPIIFALANPNPEIPWEDAHRVRQDIIMATGRSDYPNQVNNALCFPYLFRGALDVRATSMNEEMKLAAVRSLASLSKTTVPEIVNLAYHNSNLSFGKEYIIPKPLDPRLITTVAPAVAKAAMQSGVARKHITNWEEYELLLKKRLGIDDQLMRAISNSVKTSPRRLVFPEGDNEKIMKAASMLYEEGLAYPILLGNIEKIKQLSNDYHIDLFDIPVLDTHSVALNKKRESFADMFFKKRERKGYTKYESLQLMENRNCFGCMMVENQEADGFISGLTRKYTDVIRPVINIIDIEEGVSRIAAMYILLSKRGPIFLADTAINFNPNAEELANIALLVAKEVNQFNIVPKIAMLSYSNFGSSKSEEAKIVADATQIVKQKNPSLIIDGEIQGALAFNKEYLKEQYPFSTLIDQDVNVLIFPNLSSSNIAYHLLKAIGNIDEVGPILLGLKKSIHVLQVGSSVRNIFNVALIAAIDAKHKSSPLSSKDIDQWKNLSESYSSYT